MLMFPVGKRNTGPSKVHYLNTRSKDCYVERVAGHETLIKTSFNHSQDKIQYLIEEFKVEWDFFSMMAPDSLSKLVSQSRFTFQCVQNQLQINLEKRKQDEQKVENEVFVKSDKTDQNSFETLSSKLKDFNPRKCEDRAKKWNS